jgi:6,7-dimethyl-8-ribityllumazine synthase
VPKHSTINLPPVAVVVSRYNATITDALLAGAIEEYLAAGGDRVHLDVLDAPGTFELVTIADAAAASNRYAGVVCLGCIVKGQTRHDEVLAHAVAQGLVNCSLKHQTPITLGVLTVNNNNQARARAGGKLGNKGSEAMEALLMTLVTLAGLGAMKQTHPATHTITHTPRPDKLAQKTKRTARTKTGK